MQNVYEMLVNSISKLYEYVVSNVEISWKRLFWNAQLIKTAKSRSLMLNKVLILWWKRSKYFIFSCLFKSVFQNKREKPTKKPTIFLWDWFQWFKNISAAFTVLFWSLIRSWSLEWPSPANLTFLFEYKYVGSRLHRHQFLTRNNSNHISRLKMKFLVRLFHLN